MTSLEFLVSKFGAAAGDRLWKLANNKAGLVVDHADVRKLVTELLTLQAGYAAARLEIESLQARIKTMAEEHADELMVAHLDGRMRAAQPVGAPQPAPAAQENSNIT